MADTKQGNKMRFSIVIDAPRERVWDAMLGDEGYRAWTEVFAPGSHYVGDWRESSKMLFLGPNEAGEMEGMVSRVEANRKYEYISIEHLGIVHDGIEDMSSEEAQDWAGAHENYTFSVLAGATEVIVELEGATEEWRGYFEETWPKALRKLKDFAETYASSRSR